MKNDVAVAPPETLAARVVLSQQETLEKMLIDQREAVDEALQQQREDMKPNEDT